MVAPVVMGSTSGLQQLLSKGSKNTTADFLAKIEGAQQQQDQNSGSADSIFGTGGIAGAIQSLQQGNPYAPKQAVELPAKSSTPFSPAGIGQFAENLPNPIPGSNKVDELMAALKAGSPVTTGSANTLDNIQKQATGNPQLLAFAAALKLAEKETGGFNSSPYAAAIAADQSAAGGASAQARSLGARAEGDDATLYGRLGNYIKALQGAGNQDTRQTTREISQDYGNAQHQIANTYGQVNSQGDKELARLGLAPTVSGATGGSQAFLEGRAALGKADARSDEQTSGDAFDKLMQQTRGDVVSTGTGKVADEKAAMNTALENIAQSLNSQTAGVRGSEATAANAYHTSILGLAQNLLAQQAAANPNSLDNLTKQANLDKITAEAEVEAGKLPGAAGSATSNLSGEKGYANAIAQLAADGNLGVAKGGIDPTHVQTLENFLSQIEAGGQGSGPTKIGAITIPGVAPFQFNTANQGMALADAAKLIQGAKYTSADQAALDTAIRMLLGQE